MKANVCGYDLDAVDAETSQRIMAVYGIEPGCIDIGRDDDGELRSFVAASPPNATPRLFDPPASPASRQVTTTVEASGQTSYLVVAVQRWKERARELLTGSRRKTVLFAAGGVLAAVVIALALIPPSGSSKSTAAPDASATAAVNGSVNGSVSGSGTSTQADFTEPQNASIELALTGAIAGLGNMQGVTRSAVRASIASRAGDIVLIDLAVTKPTGLTAFATVLLQKVGSQWRMRQIVDERN